MGCSGTVFIPINYLQIIDMFLGLLQENTFLIDLSIKSVALVEQKEFYGSLESRKLTFFSVQLDEGLFCRILDHSGK